MGRKEHRQGKVLYDCTPRAALKEPRGLEVEVGGGFYGSNYLLKLRANDPPEPTAKWGRRKTLVGVQLVFEAKEVPIQKNCSGYTEEGVERK